ncbi:kinase-like protein, partial [Corynespora cassiicola Philippines]
SPWSSYEEIHSLRLGIDFWVTYAERRAFPYEEYSIRHFPGILDEDKLQILQKIRHPNFVTVVDIFQFEEATHVVFEHMPISLHDLSKISNRIDTIRLAAILGQVVNGLVYLSDNGLEHGSLTCSNILVSRKGEVKIAGFECCHSRVSEKNENPDIRALKHIAAVLMGESVNRRETVSITDPYRWDFAAVDFVAVTTSATSVEELKKHPLLKLPWKQEQIKRLV